MYANPWQNDSKKWDEVKTLMEIEYNVTLTNRTVEGRVDLLLQYFKSQQLKSRTGTEEQETERGKLLSEIDAIIEEEKAASQINVYLTGNHEIENEVTDSINEVDVIISDSNGEHENIELSIEPSSSGDVDVDENKRKRPAISAKKQRIAERVLADSEREKYCDEADGPMTRKSNGRLSLEDEMILKRQNHEMEKERNKIERERLEMDKRRESRLEDEGRRRDEVVMSQMIIQQSLVSLLNKFLEK